MWTAGARRRLNSRVLGVMRHSESLKGTLIRFMKKKNQKKNHIIYQKIKVMKLQHILNLLLIIMIIYRII
jgi:hypothetical protein